MIGLYFGGTWFQTRFGNQYGNVELDAALDETHDWSAEVTSNKVETGSPIADHVVEQPDKLKIRGFVSDTPLTISPSVEGTINTGDVPNRTQAVFDLLREIIKRKETLTVYTKHRIYNDMIMTTLIIPRSAGVGEAIEFTAEFVHIRKVATQIVDMPAGIVPKKGTSVGRKSEPKKDAGKKQVSTVTKPSSTLSRALALATQ